MSDRSSELAQWPQLSHTCVLVLSSLTRIVNCRKLRIVALTTSLLLSTFDYYLLRSFVSRMQYLHLLGNFLWPSLAMSGFRTWMYPVHTSFHLLSYRSTAKPLSASQSAIIKSDVMVSIILYWYRWTCLCWRDWEIYLLTTCWQQMKMKRNSCWSLINLPKMTIGFKDWHTIIKNILDYKKLFIHKPAG